MRMRKKGCNKPLIALILFGAALLCFCFMSVKVLLVVLALSLIGVGIWLLKCC